MHSLEEAVFEAIKEYNVSQEAKDAISEAIHRELRNFRHNADMAWSLAFSNANETDSEKRWREFDQSYWYRNFRST